MRSPSLATVVIVGVALVLQAAAAGWMLNTRLSQRIHVVASSAQPLIDDQFNLRTVSIRADRVQDRTDRPDRSDTSGRNGQGADAPDTPAAQQSAVVDTEPATDALRVPVLMYHEITQGPNALYVSPEELEGHLQWLKAHGYHGITLRQLYDHYTKGAKIGDHPVVLTFDDGYASYYTNALPLLKQYGFPGTLFVITGSVGKPGMITWDQVRDALKQGTEIGAHTVNHPDLEISGHDRVVYEVTESKKVLEQEIGRPVEFFCYPAGRYNDGVVKAVKDAGYIGAVTTKFGLAEPDDNRLLWSRVRVNQGTSPAGIGALIRMAEGK